ncbi:MAG: hypothetical protein KDI05_03020 [Halieaceae bacterium]|nr:hypothetical protein [Halieaceae bacterium]MCP5203389.1 hypothetical protein [Pseudomonadales bacterium]
MHSRSGLIRTGDVSLSEYFREQLALHARELEPPPREDTRWYLGNLLVRFCRSEDFFAFENGRFDIRPLALLYGDALEARDEYQRCQLLQQLGDLSLFLGALFPDNYSQRGIRQDYFVGMGCGAYDYLADNARRGRHIFSELAAGFTVMLELVANACNADQQLADEDILALYARWRATGSPRARRRLEAVGIYPVEDEPLH